MHDELGHDEQRQGHQPPYVHFDVQEKWHGDGVAPRSPTEHRQDQQRQPGDERDEENPATPELQRIAGQVSSSNDLVERSTQDDREVVGIRERWLSRRRRA